MFGVNEYIVYRNNVCYIKEIIEIKDKKYYVLFPIDDDSLTIKVPVDNSFIRRVISKDEVAKIIKNIINIDIIKVDNEKMIEQEYKKMLENATHENLIKIIKTSYLRNDKRKREKKKISEKDDTYFKLAEKILYNEFSVALKMNYEDTKKYVVDSVEKGYKDE